MFVALVVEVLVQAEKVLDQTEPVGPELLAAAVVEHGVRVVLVPLLLVTGLRQVLIQAVGVGVHQILLV
jgi:hypothetical protein